MEAMCLSETSVHVHQTTFIGAFARLLKAAVTSGISVCLSACNKSAPTKCDVGVFFGNLSRKLKLHLNVTRMMQVLHMNSSINV